MIRTDYDVDKLSLLLSEDCLSERYYPLIPYLEKILSGCRKYQCKRKSDIENRSDEELLSFGFNDLKMIQLFRRFLSLYDIKKSKFREIEKLDLTKNEKEAYYELYHLPGVKKIRAELYYLSGFHSLADFCNLTVEEIQKRTEETILKNQLNCIVPLKKEILTHIAVSKAFCHK